MSRGAWFCVIAIVLAFMAGWKGATWQRDSIDLAAQKAAAATGVKFQVMASTSARELESKLEALKESQPKEIRYEIVKPVFTNVCVSDEFVRLFNAASASAERTLSGKPENKMPGAAAAH